jgi:hypothetical protein
MAVWDDDLDETPVLRSGVGHERAARVARRGGAFVSAALIGGLVWWAWQLADRQMNGVPLIAAPEGPARLAPDDPGGELADHQGMAVNMIAALGEAEKPADLLVLAPEPAALAPEDVASDALSVSGGTPLAAPASVRGPNAGMVRPSETLRAMQPAEGQIGMPLPENAADPIAAPELETVEAGSIEAALIEAGAFLSEDELVAADVPGIATSPIPPARPGFAAAATEAAPAAPTRDVDPAGLVTGTALAHIGSFPDEAQAKLAWDAAAARFGALFDDKGRVIEAAESGGQTFYRLRVEGFADRDAARRFCAALKAAGECVPTLVR